MLSTDKCLMLSCENIRNEVLDAVKETGAGYPDVFIPREYHLSPDNLRSYLQGVIDRTENADCILLPMGLCGNGTLGLRSEKSSIVLPNCSDCIDLLLSRGAAASNRPTYSYFLTGSWMEGPYSIEAEFKHAIEKYGEEDGSWLVREIYGNYREFALVDTGTYDVCAAAERVAPIARLAEMEIKQIDGRCDMLKKMTGLNFDGDFIVIPPGDAVSLEHFTRCANSSED
jgi:hypothetical protein